MIGQTNLIDTWSRLLESNKFPRFAILEGREGQGKKTLIRQLHMPFNKVELPDISVSTIREMINDAYTVNLPTVYIISDADSMSVAAKNALLKVTEEPPRNSYFIMTLVSSSNTLATIRSRAQVFKMNEYTVDELRQYIAGTHQDAQEDTETNIVLDLCTNIAEIRDLRRFDVLEFIEYVNKVVDNIAEVSISNAFKISGMLAFKAEDDAKYNLKLFWRAFMQVCAKRMLDGEPIKYATAIQITSRRMAELDIVGINKQSLFDMWMFDIRSAWSNGANGS